jgi:hypothetical protein
VVAISWESEWSVVIMAVVGESEVDAALARVRRSWLRALSAQVRAAGVHAQAAELHARSGHAERRRAELDRLGQERAEFDATVALHPEWADAVPVWPRFDRAVWDG